MKKKLYEKPSMEVLECEQEVQLLAGSADRDPYGNPITDQWYV
jgi:hypothetical protein